MNESPPAGASKGPRGRQGHNTGVWSEVWTWTPWEPQSGAGAARRGLSQRVLLLAGPPGQRAPGPQAPARLSHAVCPCPSPVQRLVILPHVLAHIPSRPPCALQRFSWARAAPSYPPVLKRDLVQASMNSKDTWRMRPMLKMAPAPPCMLQGADEAGGRVSGAAAWRPAAAAAVAGYRATLLLGQLSPPLFATSPAGVSPPKPVHDACFTFPAALSRT